jgi:hypothetical protein
MPPRRPKDRGTDAERAVARWLAVNGWPHAERRASNGSTDRGDITGTPGICWEVKSRKEPPGDKQITDWLEEVERERVNAGADIGVLVVRRTGYGEARVASWWAIVRLEHLLADHLEDVGRIPVRMRLAEVMLVLRRAGYGEPHPLVVTWPVEVGGG